MHTILPNPVQQAGKARGRMVTHERDGESEREGGDGMEHLEHFCQAMSGNAREMNAY